MYSYITGGEKREIISEVYKAGENMDNLNKAADKALSMLIISIDEDQENILKRLKDMRAEDFDHIEKIATEYYVPKKK